MYYLFCNAEQNLIIYFVKPIKKIFLKISTISKINDLLRFRVDFRLKMGV